MKWLKLHSCSQDGKRSGKCFWIKQDMIASIELDGNVTELILANGQKRFVVETPEDIMNAD